MKITLEERTALKEKGYSAHDIQEIVTGAKKTTYLLIVQGEQPVTITEKEAIERLGREEWLRGLCRSAFEAESTRWGLNDERILIHTKCYL